MFFVIYYRITQTKTASRSEMSQRDGAVAKFSMARKKVIVPASHSTYSYHHM